MKKLVSQKFIKEISKELMFQDAIKREKTAEGKLQLILEEIAIAMKKKGLKEFNGQHFTLTMN